MSNKQREKHLADYWGGYLTRTEAQKVFDETAEVLMKQGQMIMELDVVVSFFGEKAGVTSEDIQAWYNAKVKAAEEQANASGNTEPEA